MRYTFTFRPRGKRKKPDKRPLNQEVFEIVDGYFIVIFKNGYMYEVHQYDNYQFK